MQTIHLIFDGPPDTGQMTSPQKFVCVEDIYGKVIEPGLWLRDNCGRYILPVNVGE